MREIVAIALLLSVARAERASAADHLVSAASVQEQVAEAYRDREQKIVAVEALLDTTEATRAAEVSGVSVARLKRQVALLSDADLRDLSLRAKALGSDPAAGSSGGDWAVATLVAIPWPSSSSGSS